MKSNLLSWLFALSFAWAWAGLQATEVHFDGALLSEVEHSGSASVMILLSEQKMREAGADRVDLAVDLFLADAPWPAVKVERRLETVPAVLLRVSAEGLAWLGESGWVEAIDLDSGGSGDIVDARSVAEIDTVRMLGFDGTGTKVAIIDSGLRPDHVSFQGRIVDEACFCSCGGGCCPNGQSTQTGPGSGTDNQWHGTHVAGIAVGGMNNAGVPHGAAPKASIISIRVLNENNRFCSSADIAAALDWLRVNHPDTSVVNLSLSTDAQFEGYCDDERSWTRSLASVINGLAAGGTLVVSSSGNRGSSSEMGAPACIQGSLAVGAVWKAALGSRTAFECTDDITGPEVVTCFSNLSEATDIVAPGGSLLSADNSSPTAASIASGTSMAASLVTGCGAQLSQAFPDMGVQEIRQALVASPVRLSRSPMVQDYPRLDCLDAFARLDLQSEPEPEPGSLDEPEASVFLPADDSGSCPGFYIVRSHSGPESQPGRFGVELSLRGSGRRTLQGGLNFGGRATATVSGFSAFSIANRNDESQSVSLLVNVSGPGQLALERRSGGQVIDRFIDMGILAGPTEVDAIVPPGFYVVSFRPQAEQSVSYSVSALTSYTDRPGGGFQGGVVFGGYHDPARASAGSQSTGFASFCVAEPFDVDVRVLSRPTYGSSGARGMAFSVSSSAGGALIDTRERP